jgi:hypothetical protein
MRRMYSDGQVVKVVNKAIDDGEIVIEAGGLPEIESGDAGKALVVNQAEDGAEWATVGLSPEDQEKLDNSLQLPESAPAAQQLVGINTSKEQNALTIGSGLNIDANGNINTDFPTIILDFNNGTVINNLDEALYTKLTTAGSQYIIKVTNAISVDAKKYNTYYRQSYSNPLVYESFLSNGATVQDTSVAPLTNTMLFKGKVTFQGAQGQRKAVISEDTSLTRQVTFVQYDSVTWSKLLPEGLTGTDTALKNKNRVQMGHYLSILYSDLTNKQIIRFYVNRVSWDNASSQNIVYADGKDATYDYSLE